MHEQQTVSLAEIPDYSERSLDDLLGGEWVHRKCVKRKCVKGTKRKYVKTERDWIPRCPEAYRAIKSAINRSLSQHSFRQKQLHEELKSEVYSALDQYFRRQHTEESTNGSPFLKSSNRAGWLFTFTRQTAANYFRRLIRESNKNERITTSLTTQVIPSESPAEQQARKKREKNCLNFDHYQFERRRKVQKVEDRSWQEMVFDGVPLEDINPTETPNEEVEPKDEDPSTEGIDPRLAQIRSEVKLLPEDDREFVLEYLNGRYTHRKRVHTPAERKRFQRLCDKLRSRIT